MNIVEALAKDPIARNHRGPGNVWFVHAINDETEDERIAVFSNAERACDWLRELGENWIANFAPLIVDEPAYGDLTPEHRQ